MGNFRNWSKDISRSRDVQANVFTNDGVKRSAIVDSLNRKFFVCAILKRPKVDLKNSVLFLNRFAREIPQLRASNNDTAASLDSVSSNGKLSTSIARKQIAVYS